MLIARSESEELKEKIISQWEKEITPVPQFSDKVKVMQINYPPSDKKIMDIFRAVYLSKEISKRVYDLTTIVINNRPTNYSAWVLRRECLDKVKEINLMDELKWLDDECIKNQKNYQMWHHRKLLIEKMNDVSQEKKLLDEIFKSEPKNFHAWTHRIWMIRRFNNIEGEYNFIERMLDDDIKNNSVWNYRFFFVLYLNGNKLNHNAIANEINYTIDKIRKCPLNECPYCYIRGLVTKFKFKLNDFVGLKQELEKLVNENENNRYAMNLLLDCYEEEKNGKKFNEIIEKLIKVDYIRKKYYGWRKINAAFNENKK